MKNLKIYKRVMSGTLALVAMGSALAFSGCSKENQNQSESSISISIDKTNFEEEQDKDSNLSKYPNLKQENIDEKKYEYVLKNDDGYIELLYLNKDKNYTSDIISGITQENTSAMAYGFFADSKFVVPDCYNWLSDKFNPNHSEFILRVKEFNGNFGNRYLLYETEVIFKKDQEVPQIWRPVSDLVIKKGDSLCCKCLYMQVLDLEKGNYLVPVSFEQTGMGSDCENIKAFKDEFLNNQYPEYTLIPLDEAGIIEKSIKLDSEQDLYNLIESYREQNVKSK